MRLSGVLLAVVLATSTAYADSVPFEIVRMLPETNQVLVFDRAHNTHVLLQPGAKFDDYTVIEVSGLKLTVEKQQERFVVYPREAKYLALNVLPRDQNIAPPPPVIYGKSVPAAIQGQVAAATPVAVPPIAATPVAVTPVAATPIAVTAVDAKKPVDAKAQAAQDLAFALAQTSTPTRAPVHRATQTPNVSSAKYKP